MYRSPCAPPERTTSTETRESLATVDDVNRLFACSQADNPLDQSSLLFGERLREAFAPLHPYATAAEVSLTIEPELVPMAEVIAIWVDPVETRDARLLDIVSGQAALTVQSPPVRRRYIREPRGVIYRDIVAFIADEGRPKSSVACGSLRRGRGDATVGARFDRSRPGSADRNGSASISERARSLASPSATAQRLSRPPLRDPSVLAPGNRSTSQLRGPDEKANASLSALRLDTLKPSRFGDPSLVDDSSGPEGAAAPIHRPLWDAARSLVEKTESAISADSKERASLRGILGRCRKGNEGAAG